MPEQFEFDRLRLQQALQEKKDKLTALGQIAKRQVQMQGEVTQEDIKVPASPPLRESIQSTHMQSHN